MPCIEESDSSCYSLACVYVYLFNFEQTEGAGNMNEITIQNLTVNPTTDPKIKEHAQELGPYFIRHLQNGLSHEEAFVEASRDYVYIWNCVRDLLENPAIE